MSSDVAHLDDIAELQQLLDVLDPKSRDFGTDVADPVDRPLSHGAIELRFPVTGLSVQPITSGDSRDGGFAVFVEIGHIPHRRFAADPSRSLRRRAGAGRTGLEGGRGHRGPAAHRLSHLQRAEQAGR